MNVYDTSGCFDSTCEQVRLLQSRHKAILLLVKFDDILRFANCDFLFYRHLDKDRLAELERMDRYPEKQAVYSVDKPFRQTSLDLRHNAATTNWHPTRDFTR